MNSDDLYQILGGNPTDIMAAVEKMLDAVDIEQGHPDGIRVILLICRHLLHRAVQER